MERNVQYTSMDVQHTERKRLVYIRCLDPVDRELPVAHRQLQSAHSLEFIFK